MSDICLVAVIFVAVFCATGVGVAIALWVNWPTIKRLKELKKRTNRGD